MTNKKKPFGECQLCMNKACYFFRITSKHWYWSYSKISQDALPGSIVSGPGSIVSGRDIIVGTCKKHADSHMQDKQWYVMLSDVEADVLMVMVS